MTSLAALPAPPTTAPGGAVSQELPKEDASDAETVSNKGEEEHCEEEEEEDLYPLRQEVVARFNACCPFDVRFHRTVDPTKDDWESQCHARAIGMRWNKVTPTVFCEWPIGSGEVYPQGDLGYKFLCIYAEASGTFNGDVKRPNSWRELKGCMEHIDAPTDEEDDAAEEEVLALSSVSLTTGLNCRVFVGTETRRRISQV
jgi:hypothetical protein